MHTGLFDVLHDTTEIQLSAVVQCINIDFHCVVKEPVDQHRVIHQVTTGMLVHVGLQLRCVVDDFHASPTKDKRRPHEDWVTNAFGGLDAVLSTRGSGPQRCR